MRSSIPILWRLKGQRYQLTGTQCRDCGHKMVPARRVCPVCAERVPAIPFPVTEADPVINLPVRHKEAA
ncbi:MAG: hypothetical protein Kow0031_10680 [Anaerolineae bacterium]